MVALVVFFILMILSVVAGIQVITKAGYSPWWILLPLSLPVLYTVELAVVFHGFSSSLGTYGAFDLQGIVDEAKVLSVLALLDLLANYAMFMVFAFSDWPVMQAARSRYAGPGGSGRGSRSSPAPSGPGARGDEVLPARPHSVPDLEGQPAGWHKTGAVGAGEQSYWDGSSWTARRRWSGSVWVDLPLQEPSPVGPGETSAGQP